MSKCARDRYDVCAARRFRAARILVDEVFCGFLDSFSSREPVGTEKDDGRARLSKPLLSHRAAHVLFEKFYVIFGFRARFCHSFFFVAGD